MNEKQVKILQLENAVATLQRDMMVRAIVYVCCVLDMMVRAIVYVCCVLDMIVLCCLCCSRVVRSVGRVGRGAESEACAV